MCKRTRFICVAFCAVLFSLGRVANTLSEERSIIKEGDSFPEVRLIAPADRKDVAYLGIPERKHFTIKDIQADLVLVEILNVYCASCWKQVPIFNKLHAFIESTPETKGRIKMLGIGVGNKDWEVKHFREEFEVAFPVLPDPDFVMHEATGRSWAPLSIFVRQDPIGKPGLVAATHLGISDEHDKVFRLMKTLMDMDLAAIREKGEKIESKIVHVKPILREEVQARIKAVLLNEGKGLSDFEKITLKSSETIYTAIVHKDGKGRRLFANVISRPSPCDVCHDVHFIYVFEGTGKILQFIPLQLAKYGNVPWDDADVLKMRERIVGKHVQRPFVFDVRVDAVSSATITSSVIFDSLDDGQVLYKELIDEGLI